MDSQLAQEILLLAVRALIDVNPEHTAQSLASKRQCTPVPTTLGISFIGRGASERETHADDETSNGQEDTAYAEIDIIVQHADGSDPS